GSMNCVSCYTLERIVRSAYNADEWTNIVHGMAGYAAVSQPIKPQRLMDEERAGRPEQYRRFAEYLATINLSTTPTWQYPLKTMARAKRSEEHTSELQSLTNLVCRLLLENK